MTPADSTPNPKHHFSQPNQSILAGVECLQWLATSERPIGSLEMAGLMNVDRTRANRILKSLVMAGMAEQTTGRKFVVGSGFHILAAQSLRASGILRAAAPVLEELHRLDCIVALGVLWKRSVAYLYYHQPGQSAAHAIGTMFSFPALWSSIGRVLLAELEDGEISDLYKGHHLEPFANLKELMAELAKIRENGYCSFGDKNIRINHTMAYPVVQGNRVIAAVALAEPPRKANLTELLPELEKAAEKIGLTMEAFHHPGVQPKQDPSADYITAWPGLV